MTRKLSNDEIDKFFDYGLDITNRTIYLGCAAYNDDEADGNGVDFLMAEKFIKALHILDKQAPLGDKPITIIANNPGGSWYHGMAIFGAIKSCKNHVTMKMYGYAMSMGSIIPQAADERLIDPYARFMIHYGTDGGSHHSKIFQKWGDEAKRINHAMENIYLNRMLEKDEDMENAGVENYLANALSDAINKQNELNFPPLPKLKLKFSKNVDKKREEVRIALQKLLDYDSFLSAEEVVSLGLADGLIES